MSHPACLASLVNTYDFIFKKTIFTFTAKIMPCLQIHNSKSRKSFICQNGQSYCQKKFPITLKRRRNWRIFCSACFHYFSEKANKQTRVMHYNRWEHGFPTWYNQPWASFCFQMVVLNKYSLNTGANCLLISFHSSQHLINQTICSH